jgi:transposase
VSVDDGLCGHSCLCPTKRNRGHIRPNTSSQSPGNKEAAPNGQGATRDRGRDALAGASVPRVARRHDVNANQVFYWRKLYREGQLGSNADTRLVRVKVAHDRNVEAAKEDDFLPRSGTMEIKLSKGTLRIFGTVDVIALRAAVECLVG